MLKCHFINSAFPYHCSLTSNLECIPPSLSFLPQLPIFFSSLTLAATWLLSPLSPSLPQKYKHIIRVGIFLCVFVFHHFSCVQLFATLWTVAPQTPLSMGFSRQEYWSGMPCPSSGDLLNPGMESVFPISPACRQTLLLSHLGSIHCCILSAQYSSLCIVVIQ